MSPRDLVYVGHMLDMARKAVNKIIGEAGRQVSREFCDNHPEIRWADIIGMRQQGRARRARFSRGPYAPVARLLQALVGRRIRA